MKVSLQEAQCQALNHRSSPVVPHRFALSSIRPYQYTVLPEWRRFESFKWDFHPGFGHGYALSWVHFCQFVCWSLVFLCSCFSLCVLVYCIRGEQIVFWWPNTNTNIIHLFKNGQIRIQILFDLKKTTEYKYKYYSVWKNHPNTNANTSVGPQLFE